MTMNILWIMCDQLRFDYLGCYGHPHLSTPNIDALAARGVRFCNAYVQSTVCGPSRMSAYTGRYMRSHGSTWNGVPLRVGEPTLGDHLREAGMRCVLVGKTHMAADTEGMERLGIDPDSIIGVRASECGFEPYERDDGLHPGGAYGTDPAYNAYLRDKGYAGDNPWQDWANAAEGDGAPLNGWLWKHADKAARVREEDSETPYMTRLAMDFIDEATRAGQPWCAHLSYIKPHWPYIAPAPYHDMYGPEHVLPPVRAPHERDNPHPIYRAFLEERHAVNMSREGVRETVIPAYMGLIRQIDDQLGLLFSFLAERGLDRNTVIVFSSDHGDYLGDHWLGEKYLFHDPSVKIPLIIADPSPASDATRGTVSDALVEMIDLAPTFLDLAGGAPKPHVLEGHSLLPLLHGTDAGELRSCVFSEYDFAADAVRPKLGTSVQDSRMTMVFDGRYKLVDCRHLPPILFDLREDPQELTDLGQSQAHGAIRARLLDAVRQWYHDCRNRITMPDAAFAEDDALLLAGGDPTLRSGVTIGYWDEHELAVEKARLQAVQGRMSTDFDG